ncbi:MAG: hypothetical protein AAGB27_10345 [Pseudomonadota bacterium]
MALWIAWALALLAVLLGYQESQDAAVAIALMAALALSMIFRPGWWTFWMAMGFWEQRARDSHRPDASGPAVALLGWLLLLGAVFLAFRL